MSHKCKEIDKLIGDLKKMSLVRVTDMKNRPVKSPKKEEKLKIFPLDKTKRFYVLHKSPKALGPFSDWAKKLISSEKSI